MSSFKHSKQPEQPHYPHFGPPQFFMQTPYGPMICMPVHPGTPFHPAMFCHPSYAEKTGPYGPSDEPYGPSHGDPSDHYNHEFYPSDEHEEPSDHSSDHYEETVEPVEPAPVFKAKDVLNPVEQDQPKPSILASIVSVVSGVSGRTMSPMPALVIEDDRKEAPKEDPAPKAETPRKAVATKQKVTAAKPGKGRHRKPVSVTVKGSSSTVVTAPVQNVVADKPVETYKKVEKHKPVTMSERIQASVDGNDGIGLDGNDLPEALTRPDEVCEKCKKHTPPRSGMRYCSDCFKTLPFCRNYEECGYRTDNLDHGYCSVCYYEYRELCFECRSNYYFDGTGLCQPCTQKAPAPKKGTCRNWWVEEDNEDEDGQLLPPQRVVCGAPCRGHRFCHDCWETIKPKDA